MATSDISNTFTSSMSQSMEPLVLVGNQNGVTVIPQPTPLTRLNYFDGKFLRASDLSAEQLYLRRLVDISNQAGGPGVVHGYNLSLAAGGDKLNLCPGLAIDPQGRVLLLPEAFSIGVQELIDKSRQLKITPPAAPTGNGNFADCTVVAETPPGSVVQAGNLYLITIGFAEALCGQEDVFGKLCEEACATSTDRPYRVEGIILRAIPLQLQTPLPNSAVVALSQLHLRSRVASSYFEDERKKVASFISGEGLRSDVWCFGAEAAGGLDVPLGVIARAGNTTLFLDAWIARRERIDTPAKRYWQWRMAMRPWDVFLAQILQFQCQLAGLFKQQPQGGGSDDPCASTKTLIREASDTVAKIANFYQAVTTRFTLQPLLVSGNAGEEKSPELEGGLTALIDFQKRLQAVSAAALIPSDKFLIDGGIIELPSSGYLPVTPNSVSSINEQVRRLLGRGVDLRFCIVRPDFVAHALEEAQHMERISLLQGLDDPKNKPKVDILVPNGEIIEQKQLSPGLGFEAILDLNPLLFSSRAATGMAAVITRNNIRFQGAARAEKLPSGGGAIYLGADFEVAAGFVRSVDTAGTVTETEAGTRLHDVSILEMFSRVNVKLAATQPKNSPRAGSWISLLCERNIFELKRGDTSNFNARGIVAVRSTTTDTTTPLPTVIPLIDVELNGILEITQETAKTGGAQNLKGRIDNAQFSFLGPSFGTTGPRQTILVDLDASVTLTNGAAIDIVLVYQETQFKLSANWDKQPMEVTAAIATITTNDAGQPQEITLVAAGLKENTDVLLANNPSHIQALNALQLVATALGDINFADAKARLLFPPPPPPTDDIVVRGTLDWVLFHRRRDKQCQAEQAAVVIPARRYQLWHGLVANQDFLEKTIDALHSKAQFDPEGVAFQRVDVVEFAPGLPNLISRRDDVQTDWSKVQPGNKLLYDAIASRDAAKQDGDNLAQFRAIEVEQAVAFISKPDVSKTPPEVLDDIHPDLVVPDVDGVIVILTMLQQTNCVTVAVVDPGIIQRVRFLIGDGNITQALAEFSSVIGPVQFASGTVEVQNNSLDPVLQAWQDKGFQGVAQAPLIAVFTGETNVLDVIALSQGRFIQNALPQFTPIPGPLPVPELVKSPEPLPVPGCPVILFMLAIQG